MCAPNHLLFGASLSASARLQPTNLWRLGPLPWRWDRRTEICLERAPTSVREQRLRRTRCLATTGRTNSRRQDQYGGTSYPKQFAISGPKSNRCRFKIGKVRQHNDLQHANWIVEYCMLHLSDVSVCVFATDVSRMQHKAADICAPIARYDRYDPQPAVAGSEKHVD